MHGNPFKVAQTVPEPAKPARGHSLAAAGLLRNKTPVLRRRLSVRRLLLKQASQSPKRQRNPRPPPSKPDGYPLTVASTAGVKCADKNQAFALCSYQTTHI